MKNILKFVCIGSFLLFLTASVPAQTTSEVYTVNFSSTGSVQGTPDPAPVIDKIKITQNTLINLALGRAVDAAIAANEVLALVLPDDDSEISLVVFDTNTTNTLVIVAGSQDIDSLETNKGGLVILSLDVKNVGEPENGLLDGKFHLSANFSQTPGNPVSKLKSAVIGILKVNAGSEELTILISKGTMSTSGRIATIVD